MTIRSWLVVPGDTDDRLGEAATSGADAVIIDLQTSIDPHRIGSARTMAAEWLEAHRRQITENRRLGRWVRINPLDSRQWRDDLVAVMAGHPDGIVLPKADGPMQVQQLAAELYELEQRHRIPTGSTKIMPVAGESPLAALTIATYVEASAPRIAALTWGPRDLGLAIGASRRQDGGGMWTGAFALARAQTLLTAHARGIMAIEAPHRDAADRRGMDIAASAARADGFTGMLATDAEQVAAINEAFTPTGTELEDARALLDAFAGTPETGALQFDRRTIDPAQVKHARRLLGLEDQPGGIDAPRATLRMA